MLDEWAYAKLYRSNGQRLTALPRWLETYNLPASPHRARRPTADLAALNNVSGNYI
jgi:hypothetical protein